MRVEPFRDADQPQVAALRAGLHRGFDHTEHGWYTGIWRWLESGPLGDQLHRWVLWSGGEVVGFLAAVPETYQIRGRRVVAHTPTDFMAREGYGFHSFQLIRAFFRTCQNCVTCDSLPAVIRLEEHMGATRVGDLQHMVRVLDGSALPVPAAGALRVPLDLAVRAAGVAFDTGRVDRTLQVSVLADFDERFDELAHDVTTKIDCTVLKDSAFLRWRYGPSSPQAEKTILVVEGADGLLGYAITRVTSDGRDGYLLDLTTRPSRNDVARTLLRAAVEQLRRARVKMIRYRYLSSSVAPTVRDAHRFGFFSRRRKHTLLVKLADPELHAAASELQRWAYSAGDGELSFWVK